MKVSWLLKSSTKSTLLTIIMAVLISACSSENSAAAHSNANENGITNSSKNTETNTNQPASISGTDTGSVTEDLDENSDGLLGASGKLNITDSDANEAAFNAETNNSSYGNITIDSAGNWLYGADNNQAAVQNLNNNETLTDNATISSVDGTLHTIVITINGTDETNSSNTSGETNPDPSEEPTTEEPATDTTPPANNAAIISGTDTGRVTEDTDPNGNNQLEVSGKLEITDIDANEASFIAKNHTGNFGSFSIGTDGNWNYVADNSQTAIQDLNSGDSLADNFTISSVDGTTHNIALTINGADEAITSTADITLSWVAPSEREDNSAISLSEIAGYKIYFDTVQGGYNSSVHINDGTTQNHTFSDFQAGTYYFVITTLDTEGRESQISSEIIVVI